MAPSRANLALLMLLCAAPGLVDATFLAIDHCRARKIRTFGNSCDTNSCGRKSCSRARRCYNTHDNVANPSWEDELFSVAPMMGHTNRHYRYFFRQLSRRAHLYTEMIPSSQIVNAYEQARSLVIGVRRKNDSKWNKLCAEEILEVVGKLQQRDERLDSLLELLQLRNKCGVSSPLVLQLGGRDPHVLAKASAIGAAFGYDSINLNCGCPSNAVSMGDRSGGASLMKEPMHVARCVEQMSRTLSDLSHAESPNVATTTQISVKHRLGVRDAARYNVGEDRQKLDIEEALPECRDFVRTVTFAGHVSKLQVHARLGLLGDFDSSSSSATSLWVPGMDGRSPLDEIKPVDHKRAQYRAKKEARMAVIRNRSVPPLRPGVVDMLAREFPSLDFVTNGGMKCVQDMRERLSSGPVMGAMVGRAVINHPCSFAAVDSLLWNEGSNDRPSRGEVLRSYIRYAKKEEERFIKGFGGTKKQSGLVPVRRRLVAVPFHLFAGEEGSDRFQRRIRRLISRPERHSAHSILMAAQSEVPVEALDKCVDDYNPIQDMRVYKSVQRSGPLQRAIF